MPKTLPNQNISKLHCPTMRRKKANQETTPLETKDEFMGHTSHNKYGVTKGKITYTCIIFKSYLNLLTIRPK